MHLESLNSLPIQVETPVAVVDRNIDRRPAGVREKTRACANAFVEYLFTPEAQQDFAACGFRYFPSLELATLPLRHLPLYLCNMAVP